VIEQIEPPRREVSGRKVFAATMAALVLAAVALVTAVLPAEYGIDPIGTGRLLGLTALADARPGVLSPQPQAFREDSVEFVLGPFESVEYKYRLEMGATMVYSWQSTGALTFDMHSEPENAPEGYAESFEKAEAEASHGTYIAPFSGIHGWFWENRGQRDVTVTLTTAGFYTGAIEFRDGGEYEREVPARYGRRP
jgi:hypothetical protein